MSIQENVRLLTLLRKAQYQAAAPGIAGTDYHKISSLTRAKSARGKVADCTRSARPRAPARTRGLLLKERNNDHHQPQSPGPARAFAASAVRPHPGRLRHHRRRLSHPGHSRRRQPGRSRCAGLPGPRGQPYRPGPVPARGIGVVQPRQRAPRQRQLRRTPGLRRRCRLPPVPGQDRRRCRNHPVHLERRHLGGTEALRHRVLQRHLHLHAGAGCRVPGGSPGTGAGLPG